MIRTMIALLTVLACLDTASRADSGVDQSTVRGIVSRALPAIRQGGESWINNKDCLSCHRVGFQLWALNRAAALEFETDKEQLRAWNQWATKWQNMVSPKRRDDAIEKETLTKESDTIAQLLLGRPEGDDDLAWITTYREYLIKGQQESGCWEPAGQLPIQKRPKRETKEVTTMWSLLGLFASGLEEEKTESTRLAAMNWLGSEWKGESTEWWATRLMLERSLGNAEAASQLRESLLQLQNEDGGWGWLTNEKSDALGTGIAVYALAKDGIGQKHKAAKRAIGFLNASQQGDGSWKVHGTKMNARNRVTETASYWGTCWAVIGLLELK